MKVLHVCFSDRGGGAFIGARRLHRAMLENDVDSTLLVIKKRTRDPTVIRAPLRIRAQNLLWRSVSRWFLRLQSPGDHDFRSLNIFPTSLPSFINDFGADIVQFHWICENTVPVPDLARIRPPIVWKLPDMWSFCGCEHYNTANTRYIDGYQKHNRPAEHTGLDIDRFVWYLKRALWKDKPFTIVCPSRWLYDCAKRSQLLKQREIHNIHNPVNLEFYKPAEDKARLRESLDLPVNDRIILFSTSQHKDDPRKGFHYLDETLSRLGEAKGDQSVSAVIIGINHEVPEINGIRVINLGYIWEEYHIVRIYAAADVCLFPSMADNLPNIIKESMACGTPCVAFDAGGTREMVTHGENGYLAQTGDVDGLVAGLHWVFDQEPRSLSAKARQTACRLHDSKDRVADYLKIYRRLLTVTPED